MLFDTAAAEMHAFNPIRILFNGSVDIEMNYSFGISTNKQQEYFYPALNNLAHNISSKNQRYLFFRKLIVSYI